jgi:hypothetical protein
VLYFAPADVARALCRAIDEAHASERIVVLPMGSLPGLGDHSTGQSWAQGANCGLKE